jgi:hypothetical protein
MNKVERKRVQAGKRVHAVFGGRESGGNAGGPSRVSATGSTSATVLVLASSSTREYSAELVLP